MIFALRNQLKCKKKKKCKMLEGCNLSHPGSTITIDPQPGKAMCGEKKNYMDDQQLRDNYTQ